MIVLSLIVAAALTIVDQITKYYAMQSIALNSSFEVIKNFLSFSYIQNTGVAFGFLEGMQWIYIPVTILGCLALIFALFKYKHHTFWSYGAIILLLSGGVGNLIDRIRLGYVVDFIKLHFFKYIFNFADCCVTVGAVMFFIAVVLYKENNNNKDSDKPKIANEK